MLAPTILIGALAAPMPAPSFTHLTGEPVTIDAVSSQTTVEFDSPLNGSTVPFGPVRVVIDAQPSTGAGLVRGSLSGGGITGGQWTYPTPDGGPKVFELTALNQGTHTLFVTVTDNLGHAAQASVTFTMRAPGTDRAWPVVEIITPTSDPLVVPSGAPVTFSGTASDDVALRSVTWVLGGRSPANGVLSVMGIWSKTFTGLPDGTYTFTVVARDWTGKQDSQIRHLTVGSGGGTPPPAQVPEKGGDIVNGCGAGSGLSALLLLFAPLAALRGRRRIE